MSDKKISQHFENLSEDAHKYIESEIAFYKLNAYKKAVKASSLLIRLLLIGALTLLLFSFLAIALGLLLGKMLGNYYFGFFIISGVFLIFLLVVFLFSKPFIERKTISLFNKILHE
jgi:energy-coupling factor transporter transmembrane protein EcfT